MATNPRTEEALTWGDSVVVADRAPPDYRPGQRGSVCGVRRIDAHSVAEQFGQPIGTALYLIEFGDGEAIEVPAVFLSKL